ncbi:YdbH domain-containing protein [Phenylobacterium sp.]|uniref:intermembrane phospholipid transport protein YdbH family protein n=1 Tax=Phenylobacterium sp. TaxID=1871053 RepID=UPI0037846B46
MTQPKTPSAARRLGLILAAIGVAILTLAVVLYAARRTLAREALTGWLQSKGVASKADIEAFGLTGATARLRIGDPRNPDFVAERVEVRYALRGFSLEVGEVRLLRPVLRARIRGGALSLGALDPLVAEFRRRPPRPDAAKPRIEVEDGVLALSTDYGPVQVAADARIEDGKLMALAARSQPARLAGRAFVVAAGSGDLIVTTRADRLRAELSLPLAQAKAAEAELRDGRLRLTAEAPYPDLEKKRGDGRLVVRASLTGRTLQAGANRLADLNASFDFTGDTAGWIPDLRVRGAAVAEVTARDATATAGRAERLQVRAAAPDLTWTRRGGDALGATVRVAGTGQGLVASDLRVSRLSADFAGPVGWRRGAATARLRGEVAARGGWLGLGAPTALDSAEIIAVKRGLRDLDLRAPGIALAIDGDVVRAELTEAVTATTRAGGRARLSPQAGGWRLRVAGGGLPDATAEARNVRLADGVLTTDGRVQARVSLGPLERATFDAAGRLSAGETVRFSASRCASFRAEKVELGENDLTGLTGRLCPTGGPLLTLAGGDWRIAGQAEGVAAEAPSFQVRVADGAGRLTMGTRRGVLDADVRIAGAQVSDAAPQVRFQPLRVAGQAGLAREVWTARLSATTLGGAPIGQADLRHEAASGAGGVDLDTGMLSFAEGGLQPLQLSPLAAAVGSPATGSARFTGRFDWTPTGVTSRGVLTVPRLDFLSPAGRVTGLSGEVAFDSLTPVAARPGQTLRIEAVAGALPLSAASATFGIEPGALTIAGGEASVGGGKVRVENLRVPLAPGEAARGVLHLDGVQLHDIVEASPFGDKVEFDAKVSGRIPFEVQDQKVRILGGSLAAVQPGRISIRREALSGVAAGQPPAPGAPPPTTDTVTDFAYQAMENLAFDTLSADIESRPNGRLGVIFKIVGRHDPPQKQQIRLTWMDIIRRNFLNRTLPLPSGTGVNLTLDTTLNLDDLLRDYGEYQRLRSSPPVQP